MLTAGSMESRTPEYAGTAAARASKHVSHSIGEKSKVQASLLGQRSVAVVDLCANAPRRRRKLFESIQLALFWSTDEYFWN